MSTNFHIAPPPRTVDGLLAVPIDIQTVAASFVFDASTSTGLADVTVQYTVGPTAGNPIFDLRQVIAEAWLDGAAFPVAQMASHDFGGGALTGLRILESVQTAGSVHELRLKYALQKPLSQLGGSYPPAIEWSPGPRLRFSFGLSDLNAGRYAEAWLPANLIFDQHATILEVALANTLIEHKVITNGRLTGLGFNRWRIQFPDRFTALSPLLEVRAADTLQFQSGVVSLPVSGKSVTVEAWKLATDMVDLGTQIASIKGFLADNETRYGPYLHGDRFTAFMTVGGMEYEGGTTTSTFALLHEVFHSWYARGIKPASQADGWWDEAFTTWHDSGASDAVPFNFADPPVVLCSRDPWQRRTPSNSYSDGEDFWKGMAALLGVSNVNALMSALYKTQNDRPLSTQMLEEFLLCRSGNAQVVDAFHRFVYGFGEPATPPDVWLRDDPAHTGSDSWGGGFWDSPDLWVRNQDDGGVLHQTPRHGQDNWFYARVHNKNGAGPCDHFVIGFSVKEFAGTEFVYPGDFLPCIAARAEFSLGPGETRIVKALWPRDLVPPAGSHACLLASLIARGDHPVATQHVWEHNNLAQKNLTIVELAAGEFLVVPVVIRNLVRGEPARCFLELWRDPAFPASAAWLLHAGRPGRVAERPGGPESDLDCGGHVGELAPVREGGLLTSDRPDLIEQRFPAGSQMPFPPGPIARIPIELPALSQYVVGLKVGAPADARPGTLVRMHFVQRDQEMDRITGGIAVQIRVR